MMSESAAYSPLIMLFGLGVVIVFLGIVWTLLERYAPGRKNDSQEMVLVMGGGRVAIPDRFDPDLIQQDLWKITHAGGMASQYLEALRQRFTKKHELELLKRYEDYYRAGAGAVKAQVDLQRDVAEYQRLELEDQRERAKLDAETTEYELRAALAKAEIRKIENGQDDALPTNSAATASFNAAREKKRLDIRWEIEQELEHEITTYEQLCQWRTERRRKILNHRDLSANQKEAALALIEQMFAAYEGKKTRRKKKPADDPVIDIFES